MARVPAPVTRYIAFLRAINVGGRTVKMDELRRLFEELGLANVATVIASGNVVFEASATDPSELEQRIVDHLERWLGYRVDTFVRTASELAEIAAYRPFPAAELEADGATLFITFLAAPLDAARQQAIVALGTGTDSFHVHGRELYWLRRGRLSDSTISGATLEKVGKTVATARNANTIHRIVAKYPPLERAS
ncbi:MAG: DUF1697 domain-containing protein [Vicinamibacterales bacterium]